MKFICNYLYIWIYKPISIYNCGCWVKMLQTDCWWTVSAEGVWLQWSGWAWWQLVSSFVPSDSGVSAEGLTSWRPGRGLVQWNRSVSARQSNQASLRVHHPHPFPSCGECMVHYLNTLVVVLLLHHNLHCTARAHFKLVEGCISSELYLLGG